MIKEMIAKIAEKENLTTEEMTGAFSEIFRGEATNAQIAALITSLRMKGETIEEITACANVMRDHGLPFEVEDELLEIVGTGGDGARTFNISTTSAFVLAAGGVKVAKHGNRSVSSKSGAADVLEALGADISPEVEKAKVQLEKTNMVFLYAQKYHGAMRFAGPVRKEIGIRTVFNILGPLTNPAKATMQVMGVYDKALVEPLARVLSNLGVTKALVVNGDGLDEFSLTGTNTVAEIKNGTITMFELTAEEVGLPACTKEELVGGLGPDNAVITKAILTGEDKGAKRNTVLLNAGAGFYVAGKAASIKEGIALAAETIDSGAALATMEKFIALSK